MVIKRCMMLTCGNLKWSYMTLWSRHDLEVITWSHHTEVITQEFMCQIENITPPLLLSYDHQTWPDGDLWWHKATHIASWPSDYAVVGCYVKNVKRKISYSARVMVPKLDRVKIVGERASPIKPHDHWIRKSHDKLITQNWKLLCSQIALILS